MSMSIYTAPGQLLDGAAKMMRDTMKETLLGLDGIQRIPLLLRDADITDVLSETIIDLVDVLVDENNEQNLDLVEKSYALIAQ